MTMTPDLEARLRSEARQPAPPPSPHLQTRIMADVSSLHSEQSLRGHAPWIGIATGTIALLLMLLLGLHRITTHTPDGSPVSAQIAGWNDVAERAVAVSNELHTVMADPFGREVHALTSDAERATRFLSECLPL